MTNGPDSFDVSAFMDEFVQEIEERLQSITSGLLQLEKYPDDTASLHEVFRAAHSIKGAAKIMGLETIARVAHCMEDIFETLESKHLSITPELNDLLLRGLDAIEVHTRAAEKGETAPLEVEDLCATLSCAAEGKPLDMPAEDATPPQEPSTDAQRATPPPPPVTVSETIRVNVDQIDQLISISSELTMAKLQSMQYLQALGDLASQLRKLNRGAVHHQDNLPSTETSTQRNAQHTTQLVKLYRHVSELELNYEQYLDTINDLTDQLEDQVLYMRLLPISIIFAGLPRAVRDLARQHGKEVHLTLEGKETTVDREIMESLGSPLIHLLRNAVDHGIEPPCERLSSGKPAAGNLRIVARSGGDRVQVVVEDDGRGIDPQVIRARAVEKGIVSEQEAAALSDAQAVNLIFRDGLSTSNVLTDTSGRGVGMSAARQQIERMRGTLQISSVPGEGTRFVLTFPPSLSTVHILLVESGGHIWALPTLSIVTTGIVARENIQMVDGSYALRYHKRMIPLAPLSNLLGIETPDWILNGNSIPVVILQHPEFLALAVDRLLEEREVISKSLGPFLADLPKVSGATLMGNGEVVIILDTTRLAETARTQHP